MAVRPRPTFGSKGGGYSRFHRPGFGRVLSSKNLAQGEVGILRPVAIGFPPERNRCELIIAQSPRTFPSSTGMGRHNPASRVVKIERHCATIRNLDRFLYPGGCRINRELVLNRDSGFGRAQKYNGTRILLHIGENRRGEGIRVAAFR